MLKIFKISEIILKFGEKLRTTAELPDEAYIGMELDGERNQYHFNARSYDAGLSRFFAPDLLFEEMPNQSPYCYSNNSPVNFKDPSGLFLETPGVDANDLFSVNLPSFNSDELLINQSLAEIAERLQQYMGSGNIDAGSPNGVIFTNADGSKPAMYVTIVRQDPLYTYFDINMPIRGLVARLALVFTLNSTLFEEYVHKFNPEEKKFIFNHPSLAALTAATTFFTGYFTNNFNSDMVSFYGKDVFKVGDNGEVDAFRHVLWSAMNYIVFGEATARQIADAHEYGNPNGVESMKMDYANNEIGYKIAKYMIRNKMKYNLLELVNTVRQTVLSGNVYIMRSSFRWENYRRGRR